MNLRKRKATELKSQSSLQTGVPTPASTKTKPSKKKLKTTAAVQSQLQTAPQSKAQTKKRKRKKSKDPSVNKSNMRGKKQKKSAQPSDGKGLLYMRCFSDKKTRTTFLVDGNIIETNFDPGIDITDFFADIQKKLKQKIEVDAKLENHRKPIKVVEFNHRGSPVKVQVLSPSKKPGEEQPILERVTKINFISFYSDNKELQPLEKFVLQEKIDPNSDFFQSKAYDAIKQTPHSFKSVSTKITEDSLKETKKEIAKNGGKREVSQNQVMADEKHKAKEASANKYAEATELFSTDVKWEWLHLIAHSILGTSSQDVKNLIGGTNPANTNMLFVELDIENLAKHYPQGFTLSAKAHKIDGSEIGTVIEYTITTPDFTLPFIFIAQDPNRPHIIFRDYIHKTIESIIEYAQEHKKTNPPQAPTISTTSTSTTPASPRVPYVYKNSLFNNQQNSATTSAQTSVTSQQTSATPSTQTSVTSQQNNATTPAQTGARKKLFSK